MKGPGKSRTVPALAEEGCPCCPLLVETGLVSDLSPLKGGGLSSPSMRGASKVPASAMPESLLNRHPAVPGEVARKGARYLAADGGRIPNLGGAEL
eukprot:4188029-Alexandrium_andersonii.AAC.1